MGLRDNPTSLVLALFLPEQTMNGTSPMPETPPKTKTPAKPGPVVELFDLHHYAAPITQTSVFAAGENAQTGVRVVCPRCRCGHTHTNSGGETDCGCGLTLKSAFPHLIVWETG